MLSFIVLSQNKFQFVLLNGNGISNIVVLNINIVNMGNVNIGNFNDENINIGNVNIGNFNNGNINIGNVGDINIVIKLFVFSFIVFEVLGEVDFIIEWIGDLDKYVVVSYLIQDMDGKVGDCYLLVVGQLVFKFGEIKKMIKVKVFNDSIYIGDK